ncbi:Deleted in lung and esophageal cancer protein 1 [Entophlyctis sp. JEL0112]|nr:Deleted in lung and esophageal cancer protein 1 [Entophlyctis sp. JEL0112]
MSATDAGAARSAGEAAQRRVPLPPIKGQTHDHLEDSDPPDPLRRKWRSVPLKPARPLPVDDFEKVAKGFAHNPPHAAPNLRDADIARSAVTLFRKTTKHTVLDGAQAPNASQAWTKEVFRHPGNLPKGISAEYLDELVLVEAQREYAVEYFKNWTDVQIKALESLVGANQDIQPKTPTQDSANKPVTSPGKNNSDSKAKMNRVSKPGGSAKAKESASKSARPEIQQIVNSNARDPRTGIIIGEENATKLATAAVLNQSTEIQKERTILSQESPVFSNAFSPFKNEIPLWRQLLHDVKFSLSPFFLSEILVATANSPGALENLRELTLVKPDWVGKIIDERKEIIERIEKLNEQWKIAKNKVEWISQDRKYAANKSKMIATVFSDCAQRGGNKMPALQTPLIENVVSDFDLIDMCSPSFGLFNQVRKSIHKRTDTGVNSSWFKQSKKLENEHPGILEVQFKELLSVDELPPGALEPRKAVFHPKMNSMHPLEADELVLIERMRSRVDYLRNPRFPKNMHNHHFMSGDEIFQTSDRHRISPEETSVTALRSIGGGIVASPSVVCFSNYQPFQKYSKTLTVKNRSPHSVRFRLSVPPPYEYSKYFTVNIMSTPTSNVGLVAPGMGCQYRIDFVPDSLANFEQVLVVYTEIGANTPEISFKPIAVTLRGMRPGPELTLPDVLHCGPCRDGFVAERRWRFENVGGPGRFMILHNEKEINVAELFARIGLYANEEEYLNVIRDQRSNCNGSLTCGAFEVSPSYFPLATGESAEIAVKFSARPLLQSSQEPLLDEAIVRIACDNCQVLELPLRANIQKPSVQLVSCEPRHMGILEKHILDLGEQNLAAETKMTITVRNTTRLKLSFNWMVVDNPGVNFRAGDNYSVSWSDSSLSHSDCFKLTPSSGNLNPNSMMIFEVSFAPLKEKAYEVIGRLVLEEDGTRVIIDGFDNLTIANVEKKPEPECIFELFLKGTGRQYSVESRPQLLLLPSSVYVHSSWSADICLFNHSVSPVSYNWDIEGVDESILQVTVEENNQLLIPQQDCLKFTVVFQGIFPGKVNGNLVCKIADSIGPTLVIPIDAKVEFNPSDIAFECESIDFGLMMLGSKSTKKVPLKNNCNYSVRYRLEVQKPNASDSEVDELWHVYIDEPNGILNPGEIRHIFVTSIPTWYQKSEGILACKVIFEDKGDKIKESLVAAVRMYVSVDTPRAEVRNQSTEISCFAGVPFTWTITLANLTSLNTKFRWLFPTAKSDSVVISNLDSLASGVLNPVQVLDMPFNVTFNEIGENQSLEVSCEIEGMAEKEGILTATLNANVMGLAVRMQLYDGNGIMSSGNDICLNFGNDCSLFESRSCTLLIQNQSAIESPFRLWVETYMADFVADSSESSQNSKAAKYCNATDTKKSLLKCLESSKPKVGFSSEIGKKWVESVTAIRETATRMNCTLREGRGAAFQLNPSFGVLKPFGKATITITSFNNLVGLYNDHICCEIRPWIRQRIPLTMGVDGVPVKFSGPQLMFSKGQCKIERINFGSQFVQHGNRITGTNDEGNAMKEVNKNVCGNSTAQVSKKDFFIENQSPQTICLKWNVFIKMQSMESFSARNYDATWLHDSDVDCLIHDELINNDQLEAPISIQQNLMIISPFKTSAARVNFCAVKSGFYKALLVADVGYVQPDGSVTWSPNLSPDSTNDEFFGDMSFESKLLLPLKNFEEQRPGFTNGLPLPRMRKVRLLVFGKAVEPSLDVVYDIHASKDDQKHPSSIVFRIPKQDDTDSRENESLASRINSADLIGEKKGQMLTLKDALIHDNSEMPSIFLFTDGPIRSINSNLFYEGKSATDGCQTLVEDSMKRGSFLRSNDLTAIIALRNNMENTCVFGVKISSHAFQIASIEKSITPAVSDSTRIKQKESRSKISKPNYQIDCNPQRRHKKLTPSNSNMIASPKITLTSASDSGENFGAVETDILNGATYVLKPSECVRVAICCINPELASGSRNGESKQSEGDPPNSDIEHVLKIQFENGTTQNIPIYNGLESTSLPLSDEITKHAPGASEEVVRMPGSTFYDCFQL